VPGFSRTVEVFLVLAEFGQTREQPSLELLLPTLRCLFPDAIVRGAVVDNSLTGDAEEAIGDGLARLSGDNTLHEFSGWDRGIAWLEQRRAPSPDSIFVLANDTVVREDKRDRVRGLPVDRAAEAARGSLVGWVDEYPRTVNLFGHGLRQWVDTSLVLTTRRTLTALAPLARPVADDVVFDDDWRRVFREPSPLSENYRTYLNTYFLGAAADPEFDHRWYAQEPLTADRFDAFKRKLQCVFCEHLLSARARALGIPLVDIRPQPLPIDPLDARLKPSRHIDEVQARD
jgi:hypothetical protein